MNPFVGVFYHWLGGLASGSFYVPYRGVKKWAWEVYWLAGGVFSWVFAPWIAALLLTHNLFPVLAKSFAEYPQAVGLAFLFGMMWGMGGLTFGLTMRYLGMSLGMAVALGYCTAFGFLMPPLFDFQPGHFMEGKFVTEMLGTTSGNIILFGVGVCMLGIVIAALAGTSKEREMSEEAKKAAIKEFSFVKGLLVATFSGIMSAGMAYGMKAASPIAEISLEMGTPKMWSELPRLCVILAGGFTSNFLWCLFLFMKNKTGHQFLASHLPDEQPTESTERLESVTDAPGEAVAKRAKIDSTRPKTSKVPMLANYIFCAIAGTTWYLQFFFYSMGETQMGAYQFSSWPLHMASIMIFSSLWGLALHEWRGSSGYTKTVLYVTLFTLIFSTIIIGYGTHIGKVDKENQFLGFAGKIALQTKILHTDFNDEMRNTILDEVGKIAKFKIDGKKPLNENIQKRKIGGLLDDIGLLDYETKIDGEAVKPARIEAENLIAQAERLANAEDPVEAFRYTEFVNESVQKLVEYFKDTKK